MNLNQGDSILMIDRYQMGRMKFNEYFILDQFAEESHPLGHSKVYFWQDRLDINCTVKVCATYTDSNESAHKARDHFMSNLANPSAFVDVSKARPSEHLFKKVEAVKVYFSEEKLLSATLIWGNIFFHINSNGEHERSIEKFIHRLGENWLFIDNLINKKSEIKNDENHLKDFKINASKTELKVGEVATLSKKGPDNEHDYNSLIYIAFPRKVVDLYKENNEYKLKIKPTAAKAIITPRVMMIGVQPDGKYALSNRLKFTIVPS